MWYKIKLKLSTIDIKEYWIFIYKGLEILATIVTILGVGIVGIWKPLKSEIPYIERKEFIEKVELLRTMQNREFVVQTFGVAPNKDTIQFDKQEIVREMYVNEYASIVCYYKNDTLFGFVIIGNTDKFKYTDYRSGAVLFQTNIKEAAEQSYGFLTGVKQMIGGRMDCNRYYSEYYTQHLYGDEQIVGYAICDIGFMDTEMNERFDSAPVLYLIEKNNKGISDYEILDMDDMKEIRESKFNTYFTVAYDGIDAEEFIEKVVVDDYFLGLNKGQYFNLYFEYEDYKKLYE